MCVRVSSSPKGPRMLMAEFPDRPRLSGHIRRPSAGGRPCATMMQATGAIGCTYGWINDHFLNTPDTAAHPVPETSVQCGGGPCYGSSCTGKNPVTGCQNDAIPVLSRDYKEPWTTSFTLQVRYSPLCHASWGRFILWSGNGRSSLMLSAWNPGRPSQYLAGIDSGPPPTAGAGLVRLRGAVTPDFVAAGVTSPIVRVPGGRHGAEGAGGAPFGIIMLFKALPEPCRGSIRNRRGSGAVVP